MVGIYIFSIKSYYDTISNSYDLLYRKEQEKKLDKIKNYLDKRIKLKKSKGIDLGCGTGVSLLYLKKYCKITFGVDISRKMILKALSKLKFKPIIKNICNFRLKDKFDIIFCITVLQDNRYPEKILKTIRKISKKKSLIVISVTKTRGFLHWYKKISKFFKIKRKILDKKDFVFICLR